MHMTKSPIIVWFRQDLRITDNPALNAAGATGRPIIALYILDDHSPGAWRKGGASRWWVNGSLSSLSKGLKKLGLYLALRRGRAADVLYALISETSSGAVYWNRCYEPFAIERDKAIKTTLRAKGVNIESFNSSLLFEPWELRTLSQTPFKVFAPFYKAALKAPSPHTPLPAPKSLRPFEGTVSSDNLETWALQTTTPDWAGGLREAWTPGEASAQTNLHRFLDDTVGDYYKGRDIPGQALTSRQSPHLHFGEISPHQIWHTTLAREPNAGTASYLREVVWREFAYHLLFHWPAITDQPLRADFKNFPWATDAMSLKAWQRGQTGYPIVDAGMRELWTTGWMHNRVRMIAASFLVKHLLQPWQVGAAWFWDTLVDADLANNSASWQWVAGCGTDAAPYFRVFNPVLQGLKFDGTGEYVRRWVPEIAALPNEWIHKPWDAPMDVLASANLKMGSRYPWPIIELTAGRDRALAALKTIRQTSAP